MSRVIAVKVNAKARLNKLEEDGAGGYTVWTTAAPDKGAANDAVQRALADHFGISRSAVILKRGSASRRKIFKLDD